MSATASTLRSKPPPREGADQSSIRAIVAELRESLQRIGGRRSIGALDVMEPEPEIVHPAKRVALGELVDDPASSDGGEPPGEGFEIGHVVEDVPDHRHVHPADPVGDVGPSPVHGFGLDAGRAGVRQEAGEHVLLRVDADQHARAAGEG